jgi:hypothetical protein
MAFIERNFEWSEISSPIKVLGGQIQSAPWIAIPEHKTKLTDDLEQLKLRYLLRKDRRGLSVNANVEHGQNHIAIGIDALEVLWAYSYSFTGIIKASNTDLPLHERCPDELRLLCWACLKQHGTQQSEVWPKDLPQPKAPPSSSNHQNANGLFIYTLTFILLHEASHFALRHEPTAGLSLNALRDELDADERACQIMFDSDPLPLEAKRRARAVLLALCVVALDELWNPPNRRTTHPRPTERILAFLNSRFLEHRSEVREDAALYGVCFLFVFLTLLHYDEAPKPDFADPESYFHEAAVYFR